METKMVDSAPGIKINKNARVIIRNLPFTTDDEGLRLSFGKYGKILEIHLPQKNGKPAGFGFINYKSVNSVDMACRHMNNTVMSGRTIQVAPALSKQFYDKKPSAEAADSQFNEHDVGNVKLEDEESVSKNIADDEKEPSEMLLDASLRKKSAKKRKLADEEERFENDASESERDTASLRNPGTESDSVGLNGEVSEKSTRKPAPTNVSKTLFVRNVPFDATEDTIRPVFEHYGKVEYALPCTDRATGVPRGTAFVRFHRAVDMERALSACDSRTGEMKTGGELNGRKLRICVAVIREKLQNVVAENATHDRNKSTDKRNLHLINIGTVMRNSDDIEGVSESDMQKRDLLQQRKKVTLKDLHVFISPTRLSIHNLPKNCDDVKLRKVLLDAVGHESGVKLKECRVMRDLKRLDAVSGKPVSKGFGFAEFDTHEHALKALLSVNNNPDIFRRDRRPIVEFSLENRNALLKRKRRLEHSQLRQGQLNEIKAMQKFGVPLSADDHATLAGKKPLEVKNKSEASKTKGKKQHVNRAGNRGAALSSWNKPKSKKKRLLYDNAPTEEY